jgi:hypothetical protein
MSDVWLRKCSPGGTGLNWCSSPIHPLMPLMVRGRADRIAAVATCGRRLKGGNPGLSRMPNAKAAHMIHCVPCPRPHYRQSVGNWALNRRRTIRRVACPGPWRISIGRCALRGC